MVTERLEVRLDAAYRRKLDEVARRRGMPVSALVREMIDRLYEDTRREERVEAARRIIASQIEAVPDPAELNQQLDERRGRYADLS